MTYEARMMRRIARSDQLLDQQDRQGRAQHFDPTEAAYLDNEQQYENADLVTGAILWDMEPGERDVILLLLDGCDKAEICRRLHLSANAFEQRISRLRAKYGEVLGG